MLTKDSYSLGTMLGITVPIAGFGLLYLINFLIERFFFQGDFLKFSSIVLVSITLNLIVMRYYLVKLNYDRTGRGILVVTFVLMVLFFTVIQTEFPLNR
jgi:hypothetical protein